MARFTGTVWFGDRLDRLRQLCAQGMGPTAMANAINAEFGLSFTPSNIAGAIKNHAIDRPAYAETGDRAPLEVEVARRLERARGLDAPFVPTIPDRVAAERPRCPVPPGGFSMLRGTILREPRA